MRRRGAGGGGVGLDRRAVGVLQVHRRHEVEVGVQRVGAGVDQDHADAAGLLHGQALVDARGHAAIADHDLAGHLGRVEHGRAAVVRGREAQRQLPSDPRRAGRRRGIDQRRRADGRGDRERRCRSRRCPASPSLRRCGCACPPPPWSATGRGAPPCELVGPLLPAEAATNTPASAANRKAISTGSRKLVSEPLIEKLITSTPSATAWSIAATLSVLKQRPPVPVSQQTL